MIGGPPTFDLQSHSRFSDGELSPSQVVATAAAAGVELLALSDHDTVDGVREALAAGRRAGLRVCPAVEISAIDVAGADLHILGYLIGIDDENLLGDLERYRGDRERRMAAMVEALRESGFELDEHVLAERLRVGKPVGRPHIAQAVVSHPANQQRLRQEALGEASAFLGAYLTEGAPAFRPRQLPTVREAVETIHRAGGLAVWAHPFWDVAEPVEALATVDRFHDLGVDGVECFYVTHTAEQTKLLVHRCAELGLLRTGSSDFHGPHHRLLSAFRAFTLYGLSPELGAIAAAG